MKKIIFFCVAIFAIGCNNSVIEKPSNLIEKDKNFSKKIQNSIKDFTPKQEESLKFDGAGDLYSKLLKEFEKKYIKKFFANYYSKELCFVFGKVKINLEDIISLEPNKTENEGEG